jgi:hypothetical protein
MKLWNAGKLGSVKLRYGFGNTEVKLWAMDISSNKVGDGCNKVRHTKSEL